jgi:agmatinase
MAQHTLTTFLDLPYVTLEQTDGADVVIQGAPFDLATTGRPGSRLGPDAIRAASRALLWEDRRWPWEFVLAERLRVVDRGNVAFPPGQTSELVRALTDETRALLQAGRRVFTFGGDHYITLALLRAHAQQHGPLALVQFDAHTDTDVEQFDHHGVMFHRAVQEGLLDPRRCVQVGIRTYYDPPTHPFTVLDADWVNTHGPQATAERLRAVVNAGAGPIYLSFDIDCLDPAFAPGTGTPVAFGLSSNCAAQVLRGLRGLVLTGVDLVEVSPPYDPSGITALAGATIALDLLHLMASAR